MSEFNEFAQRLNVAFTTAAEKQKEAADEYRAAEQAEKSAKSETERIDADAALRKAKEKLNDVQRHTWPEFEQARDKIGRELQSAVNKSQAADPSAVDAAAVSLLDSGMLTAGDLESMAGKYSDNPTMNRMIRKKAGEMVDGAKEPADRARLVTIAHGGNDADTMAAWDKLCSASEHYSGQLNRNKDASYICKVNEHWADPDVQNAIKNF